MKKWLILLSLLWGLSMAANAQLLLGRTPYQLSFGLEPNYKAHFVASDDIFRDWTYNCGLGVDVQLVRSLSRIFWFQFGIGYDYLRSRDHYGVVTFDPTNTIVINRQKFWIQHWIHDLKIPLFLIARIHVGKRFWVAPATGITIGKQLWRSARFNQFSQTRGRIQDGNSLIDRVYVASRFGIGYTLNKQWLFFVEPTLGFDVRLPMSNRNQHAMLATIRTSLVHTFGWEPGPTRRALLRQQRRQIRKLD